MLNDVSVEILKSRRFLPLFITQFLGAINDNIMRSAIIILISYKLFNTPENAGFWATMSAGAFIIPFFLFSSLAGEIADKFSKTLLIQIIKFSEVAIVLFTSYLLVSTQPNLYLLISSIALMGTHAAFFGPVKYSILPEFLHKKELIAGNGLIEAFTFLAIVLGGGLGGILILLTKGSYITSTTLIIIAIAGFIASMSIPKTNSGNNEIKIKANIFKATQQIIDKAINKTIIIQPILGISWFWFIGTLYITNFPNFAHIQLSGNTYVLALINSVFTIGIGIGSIACNRLLKGEVNARYSPFSLLIMTLFGLHLYFGVSNVSNISTETSIGIATFLASISNWRILFDLFGISLCGGIFVVPLYAMLQKFSKQKYRSRSIASCNIISSLFMVLASLTSLLFFKFLAFTTREIFLFLAISNSIISLYLCRLLPYDVFRLICTGIFKLFYRLEVRGLENFNNAGKRVVIVSNHLSFIDVPIIASQMPGKIFFAVNTVIAKLPIVKLLASIAQYYPVDPNKPIKTIQIIKKISRGQKCLIFPEGRITTTGSLMKVYEGAAIIADRAKATILPIHLEGPQYAKKLSRLGGIIPQRWFPKVIMTVLPSERIVIPSNLKGKERRQALSDQLYKIMTKSATIAAEKRTMFHELLNARTNYGGNHTILQDHDYNELNYEQLITKSLVLGTYLAEITTLEEKIGVMLPNTLATTTSILGLTAYTRIPVMINFSSGIKNILSACTTSNIKQIITSKKFIELIDFQDNISAITKLGIHIIYLEEVKYKINMTHKLTGKLYSLIPSLLIKRYHQDINTPAIVFFTSGSTGKPKGIVLSHKNLIYNTQQARTVTDITSQDSLFNALPFFHAFGFNFGLLMPITNGVKTILYPNPLHYNIITDLVYNTQSTILIGTSTFLSHYQNGAHNYDFSRLRLIFSGGEKLSTTTAEKWQEMSGKRIFEGYGTTEASPLISVNTPMYNKANTVGQLMPGIEFKLKPFGEHDPSIAGELCVKGDNIMYGYMSSEQPGKIQIKTDPWLETGDIVTIDDQGYISIIDRKKRFAKIGGEMVSLNAVEQEIRKLWPDSLHAIVTQTMAKTKERLILITEHQDANIQAVIKFFKQRGLTSLNIPCKIIKKSTLPLLGLGKIDYHKLISELT